MEEQKQFKHPSFYQGDAPETEHPFSLYISVWILLFVLSAFSYAVDIAEVEGYLRWFLYIKTSIVNPMSQIAEGYAPVMPAYATLSEEELTAITDYIKTLSE